MHSQTTKKLPMFPLSLFILPDGITRLRIFEPRYLRMIGLAKDGFVIAPHVGDKQNVQWASWVEIINFDQGQDGVLEIDVRCKSMVNMRLAEVAEDKLAFVEIQEMPHWAQKEGAIDLGNITGSLSSLIDNNTLLQDLYLDKRTDNPYWVIARWLELLPIPLHVKSQFIAVSSYTEAKKLVSSII